MKVTTDLTTAQTGAITTDRTLEHLALLLDTSSSMNWGSCGGLRPIEAVQRSVEAITSATSFRTTELTVVTFDSTVRVKKLKAHSALDIIGIRLKAEGGTDMTKGIDVTLETGAKRIVLLTDGEPNNRRTVLEAAHRAAARGVRIDTIATGDADDALLKEIAEITGGTFSRCNSVADMQTRFVQLETRNYLRLTHQES